MNSHSYHLCPIWFWLKFYLAMMMVWSILSLHGHMKLCIMNWSPRSLSFCGSFNYPRTAPSPCRKPLNNAYSKGSRWSLHAKGIFCKDRGAGKIFNKVSCRPSRLSPHQLARLRAVWFGGWKTRGCFRFFVGFRRLSASDFSKSQGGFYFLRFVPKSLSSKSARKGHNC